MQLQAFSKLANMSINHILIKAERTSWSVLLSVEIPPDMKNVRFDPNKGTLTNLATLLNGARSEVIPSSSI